MTKAEKETKEVLRGFGFDEFMSNQIFLALKNKDLINYEPLGDSYSIVHQTLEDEGWEIDEVQSAIAAMLKAGVVFRER